MYGMEVWGTWESVGDSNPQLKFKEETESGRAKNVRLTDRGAADLLPSPLHASHTRIDSPRLIRHSLRLQKVVRNRPVAEAVTS
jgi:hypothetical protein